MNNQQNKPLLRKQQIVVLMLAIFILIISGGFFYYRYDEKKIRQEQYDNLKSVADLKTSQIVNWRDDRLADADVFAETIIRQKFQQWVNYQDSIHIKELLERFSLLKFYYKYQDIIIISAEGNLLPGLDTNLKHLDSEIIDNCNTALQKKKSFMGDFYLSPVDGTIHIDVFAPLLSDKNIPVAVLVLRINPYDFLYPLFQSWPASGKSAETLIIRKDGDSVEYVNELRHISNTALKLKIPLTSTEVPAVQAVLGSTGITEGTDYRGVSVLADMRQIPGSPWYMIAKIDQSEVFSELRYRTIIVISFSLLLLLSFGIGISRVYNKRLLNIYRKLIETGTALQEEKDRIRTILDQVGDPIFVQDSDHRIILANRAFYDIFCLDEKSAIGFTLAEATPENERQHFSEVDRRVLDTGISDIREEELTVRNHTLTVITRKTCFTDESGKRFLVCSIHDITDRKLAEEKIIASGKNFRAIFESHSAAVAIIEADTTISMVNDSYCKMSGFSREEVTGTSWTKQIPPDDLERLKEYNRIRLLNPVEAPSEYEFTFYHKNGEIKHAMMSVGLIQETNKIIVSFIDISQLKQAEQELIKARQRAEESEANLKAALENSQAGIAIAEYPSGKLKYVNKAALLIRDKEYNEIAEAVDIDNYVASWQIFHFDGTPYQADEVPLARALIYGETNSREFIVRRDNNEDRYVWANAAPIFNEKGIQTSAIVVFLDITERKLAETALLKSETEFRQLAEAMPQIVWITRPDGWNIFFNQQWVDYTGLSLEESYGDGWNKPFHPADQLLAWDAWKNATANLATYSIECRLRRFDGEYKWWLIRGIPVCDESGVIVKWFGTCTDIDEIKCSEAELLTTKEKYRQAEIDLQEAQQLASIGSWHWNLKTGLVAWSKELYNINGHNPDIPVPLYAEMESYYTAESWKALNEAVARTFNTGEPYNIDVEMIKPDGTVIFTNTRGCAYYNEAGEMVNLQGTVQDITDRKQAEEALKLSEGKYRQLVNNTDIGFVIVDDKGNVVEANDPYLKLAGFGSFEEISGRSVLEWTAPDEVEKNAASIALCAKQGYVQNFETVYQRADGTRINIILDATIQNLPDARRQIVAFCRNITERKQAEAALKESESRFKNMFEDHNAIMLLINPESGNIIGANEASARFYGYSKMELLTMSIDKIKILSSEQINMELEQASHQKRNYFVFQHQLANGEVRIVEVYSTPIYYQDQRILFSIVHDITERRQAEQQLIISKEKAERNEIELTKAQQIALLGSWYLDLETNEVKWTEELYKMYGFDPSMPPPPFAEHMKLFTPQSWEILSTSLAKTQEAGIPYELELKTIRKDNSNGWMWVRGEAVLNDDNKIIGLWGAAQDITNRKLAEEEIKTKVAELERFNRLSVGRELRVIELKKKINELSGQLNLPQPYAMEYLKSTDDIPDIRKK